MERIQGQIDKVTFTAEESGFSVLKVLVKGKKDPVTAVGRIASPTPGEILIMDGEWANHPQFGRQFKIHSYERGTPATVEGITKYLSSGLIKGIGPVMAERMVALFGKDTLDVVESEPERLLEVEGLGSKRLDMIVKAWEEQREVRRVMLFLQEYGVGTSYAFKIYKKYGDSAVDVVRSNPYQLAFDIHGIGFKTADSIANRLGHPPDSPLRIQAGVYHALWETTNDGHVYYPYELLKKKCVDLLGCEEQAVVRSFAEMESQDRSRIKIEDLNDSLADFKVNNKAVYLSPLYKAEKGVSDLIAIILNTKASQDVVDADKEINRFYEKSGIEFAPRQVEAVKLAVNGKATVITGGPGTGKTTIIKAILSITRRAHRRVLLAAPTGRAAKRMSEATGGPATTIHRLLEFTPQKGGFQKCETNLLDCDLLIVDEASMIDVSLMHSLLKAVPPESGLILVGDIDQLPSVGPGAVLNDLIKSESVPVVQLTDIFRQAGRSDIVVNAHRINRGEPPLLRPADYGLNDFYLIERHNPEDALSTIIELVAERIPKRFKFDPIDEVQILCPMHKGLLGAFNMNQQLQNVLNPRKTGLSKSGYDYKTGDKVMQIRNNYDKDVFNGDTGRILEIDMEENEIWADIDGRIIKYDATDLDELVPAYAITVHKSQGSEYPAVVIPVTTQHYVMLQRNLLYTAVTRGRKLAILVGTKKAVSIAVGNDKTRKRYTQLEYRLRASRESRLVK